MYGKSVLFSYPVVSTCSLRYYSKKNSTNKLLEFLATMPKANTARISEAQRQRQHIAKKGDKYGPSTIYLQVLGSGARGVPNTLYLFTDQKRYLFNCGECTQRLAHEHKVKLSRLDDIFITSKTWQNLGGLPGLSLTLQDVGVPNITLHGPDGLDELYKATKRFVIMNNMKVTMAKCSPTTDFEDGVMTVKYVLLGQLDDIIVKTNKPVAKKPKLEPISKELEEFIHDDTEYYMKPCSKPREPEAPKRTEKFLLKNSRPDPMKKKSAALQELQKNSKCSVAYICTLKKRMGTLDLEKCVELGVKPGPQLGQLKSGHDVVLPNGTIVLSKSVKTPDDPGPVFIVLDVPDISYLKESEFAAHFDNGQNPKENIPTLIVHFTPPEVFKHPLYRAFLASFGSTPRHLVLNSLNSCLGSEAVHRTQHKLHLLDPDIFPLLRDASIPAVWNAQPPLPKTSSPIRIKGLEELKNKIAVAQFQNIINMEGSIGDQLAPAEDEKDVRLEFIAPRSLTQFHLRPKKQLDRAVEPKLHIQDYIQETMDVDGFAASLEQFRHLVDDIRYAKSDSKEYPKIVFLGTGSCIPSKTRNTSAIILQIDESHSMLLDCGEGTFGQLVRFFGPKRVNAFLRTLKAIYVSHLHADHHIGLIGVLQARRQAFDEIAPEGPRQPVHLLAPGQIMAWLTIYDQQFERIRQEFTLLPNQNLLHTSANPSELTSTLASIGVSDIRTCLVSHCPNAFGVAVHVNQDYKLTYSGDTIPCEELVTIGQNSTVLIHEATMEDELVDEARVKMHSTTSQAIEMGQRMDAKYTVLTHFSQRYARLPRLNAHILNDNRSVGIAFDNMQLTVDDLELLPHMYAPLQLMFAEHCVEMELKAAHRARQKERQAISESSPTEGSADPCTTEDEPSNSQRHVSPGCRPVTAPAPVCARAGARYRETNASRLRQENKGMSVSGMVKQHRSYSLSPVKAQSGSIKARSSFDNVVPPRRPETAKIASGRLSVSPNSTNYSRRQEPDYFPNKRCSIDIKRSHSTESNLSLKEGIFDVMQQQAIYTVNSGKSRCTFDRTSNNNSLKPDVPNAKLNSCGPVPRTGYGKPLVTPVNKKLTVRRDVFNRQPSPPNYTIPLKTSGLSPYKLLRRDREPTLTSSGRIRDVTKNSSQIIRGTISTNRAQYAHITQSSRPDNRSSTKLSQSSCRLCSPSMCSSKVPPKQSISNSSRKDINITSYSKVDYHRNVQGWNPSVSRNIVNVDIKKQENCKCKLQTRGDRRILTNENGRKSSITLKEGESERLKQRLYGRDISSTAGICRLPNSSNQSNKNFKPQLEDITSSHLLLKRIKSQVGPRENSVPKRRNSNLSSIPIPCKPKPYNEDQRKMQLIEAKKRFQSKDFWKDSKNNNCIVPEYDKIEGLNWITWK